jgi:AraC family transcriptional regulator
MPSAHPAPLHSPEDMYPVLFDIEHRLETPTLSMQIASCSVPERAPFDQTRAHYTLSRILTPGPNETLVCPANGPTPSLVGLGRMVFLPAQLPVHFHRAEAAFRISNFVMDAALFEDVTGIRREWGPQDFPMLMDFRSRRVHDTMCHLEQETVAPGYNSRLLVESLAYVIMIEIARALQGPAESDRRRGALSDWQVQRVVDYVRENCGGGSTPSIANLASVCGISPGHLMRTFKNTTGEPLYAFIESVRLDKAKQLLSETDTPLKLVAAETGFATPSRFSERFRKVTGERPSEYRARTRYRPPSSQAN